VGVIFLWKSCNKDSTALRIEPITKLELVLRLGKIGEHLACVNFRCALFHYWALTLRRSGPWAISLAVLRDAAAIPNALQEVSKDRRTPIVPKGWKLVVI